MTYKCIVTVAMLMLHSSAILSQINDLYWYSTRTIDNISIHNSYPNGGPYLGEVNEHYNHSYLVFFSRISNESEDTVSIQIEFSTDSIPIPNSPNTYMKLLLPDDIMKLSMINTFSYGLSEVDLSDGTNQFNQILRPGEDCLVYVVAFFYQTEADSWSEYRGGNRAEFIIEGKDLVFRMFPQIQKYSCGNITKT